MEMGTVTACPNTGATEPQTATSIAPSRANTARRGRGLRMGECNRVRRELTAAQTNMWARLERYARSSIMDNGCVHLDPCRPPPEFDSSPFCAYVSGIRIASSLRAHPREGAADATKHVQMGSVARLLRARARGVRHHRCAA